MGILDFFKRALGATPGEPSLKASWSAEGVRVEFAHPLNEPTTEGLLDAVHEAGPEDTVLAAYLSQLVTEGRCRLDAQGALIGW